MRDSCPCPVWSDPRGRRLFGHDERAVDEAFGQIELAPRLAVGDERFQAAFKRPLTRPALVATMAGLVWRIAVWQVDLLRAGP
jgi:hypothetical protein